MIVPESTSEGRGPAEDPASVSDFNRIPEGSGRDALELALTEYGRITVTPDEADRQLLAAYGPDRIPGTESRRRSQMVEAQTCWMPDCHEPARSCGWRYTHCNVIHRHGSCSVESCTKPHKGRGLCGAHYMRWLRHGDPLVGAPPRPMPSVAEIKAEAFDALSAASEEAAR